MFKFTPPHAIKSAVVATTLALSAFSLSAQAALTSYTNAGKDLVYSSVSDVTWTKDANLYYALLTNVPGLTQTMRTIAASNGLTAYGWTGGREDQFDWTTAYVFTLYLNSINYGGSNQWRLPTAANPIKTNITGNGTTAGDEFIELFYQELNGTTGSAIPNTAYFENEQYSSYWTGTEVSGLAIAHVFLGNRGTYIGRAQQKQQTFYAWAVSPGRINTATPSAVPVPAAAWLFGSGLLGLVGLRRRKQVV